MEVFYLTAFERGYDTQFGSWVALPFPLLLHSRIPTGYTVRFWNCYPHSYHPAFQDQKERIWRKEVTFGEREESAFFSQSQGEKVLQDSFIKTGSSARREDGLCVSCWWSPYPIDLLSFPEQSEQTEIKLERDGDKPVLPPCNKPEGFSVILHPS